MKFLRAIAFALALLAPLPAVAQPSTPNWTYGYVPSPAEWSFWFGKKVDWQGAAYCPVTGCTFTGPLLIAPSTALGAGINLGQGVAPSSPVNGDIWLTSSGMFVRVNGVTTQVLVPGGPFTITSNSSQAFTVGPNGATNPVFQVDGSVGSQATGVQVQGQPVGSGVSISVISPGTNENLTLSAKGTGSVNAGPCAFAALGVTCTSTSSSSPFFSLANTTSDNSAPQFLFSKSRSGGATNSGDLGGSIFFQYFGTGTTSASYIRSVQAAASVGNAVPTRLDFANSNASASVSQILRFDQNGHLGMAAQQSAPSISGGCGGAGSSIQSSSGTVNDMHGTVVGQTAAATTCSVSFGGSFTNNADCTFVGFQSPITVVNAVSTGGFQVTFASTANYKFTYHCHGL